MMPTTAPMVLPMILLTMNTTMTQALKALGLKPEQQGENNHKAYELLDQQIELCLPPCDITPTMIVGDDDSTVGSGATNASETVPFVAFTRIAANLALIHAQHRRKSCFNRCGLCGRRLLSRMQNPFWWILAMVVFGLLALSCIVFASQAWVAVRLHEDISLQWILDTWTVVPYSEIKVYAPSNPAVFDGSSFSCPHGHDFIGETQWPGAIAPEHQSALPVGTVYRNSVVCLQRDPHGQAAATYHNGVYEERPMLADGGASCPEGYQRCGSGGYADGAMCAPAAPAICPIRGLLVTSNESLITGGFAVNQSLMLPNNQGIHEIEVSRDGSDGRPLVSRALPCLFTGCLFIPHHPEHNHQHNHHHSPLPSLLIKHLHLSSVTRHCHHSGEQLPVPRGHVQQPNPQGANDDDAHVR